jgi:hypothetical protein
LGHDPDRVDVLERDVVPRIRARGQNLGVEDLPDRALLVKQGDENLGAGRGEVLPLLQVRGGGLEHVHLFLPRVFLLLIGRIHDCLPPRFTV